MKTLQVSLKVICLTLSLNMHAGFHPTTFLKHHKVIPTALGIIGCYLFARDKASAQRAPQTTHAKLPYQSQPAQHGVASISWRNSVMPTKEASLLASTN